MGLNKSKSSENEYIEDCLAGKDLYGDNFNEKELERWYEQEKEAYADLYADEGVISEYPYGALNSHHCFKYLPQDKKLTLLSIGGAHGEEIVPIVKQLKSITILEPSDQFKTKIIQGVPVHYQKPEISGRLPFEDGSFDVITCFGVLHHIPNVSFVLSEIHRILTPGGMFLFREPIVSMGDWRKHRPGLTRNERGIPLRIFNRVYKRLKFRRVNTALCFTKPFDLLAARMFKIHPHNETWYVRVDEILGRIFRFNLTYHAKSNIRKLRPSCLAGVLQKQG
jgi:SAM-dependent methyltransferase